MGDNNNFEAEPGINYNNLPDTTSHPIDYLKLFFTETFVKKNCDFTNAYADKYISTHQKYLLQKPKSRVHQ